MKIESTSIYFNIQEANKVENEVLEKFGQECSIIGLGNDFFKIVQHGDGLNTKTHCIRDIGDWWQPAWNQAV